MKLSPYLPLGATVMLVTTRTSWASSSLASCIASSLFSGLAIAYLLSAVIPQIVVNSPRFIAFYFVMVGYLLLEVAAAQFDADPQVMVFTAGVNALAVLAGLGIELFFFARSRKWI